MDQRETPTFGHFADRLAHFARVAADYESDYLLFPELMTLQLLSTGGPTIPASEAVDRLTEHTPAFTALLQDLARRHDLTIIGGSHLTRVDGGAKENVCFTALPDGSLHPRSKIHATPSERAVWGITGGQRADVIDTEHGPIGVLICYDSEFPELVRHLVDQGARLLFVPFCTDERLGYLRVRYCCHARTVENQVYLAMAGTVGNLPNVANMDVQYAQSAILTPCDFPFARDGVAAETSENVEMVAFADLRLDALERARARGTTRNLADRRLDLYGVDWKGE
jgi:predicted amidohydrolase